MLLLYYYGFGRGICVSVHVIVQVHKIAACVIAGFCGGRLRRSCGSPPFFGATACRPFVCHCIVITIRAEWPAGIHYSPCGGHHAAAAGHRCTVRLVFYVIYDVLMQRCVTEAGRLFHRGNGIGSCGSFYV